MLSCCRELRRLFGVVPFYLIHTMLSPNPMNSKFLEMQQENMEDN